MLKNIKAFDDKIEIIDQKINEFGYLIIECVFARTGIQERYGAEISPEFEASRLYKEYRSPEEIFKESVLKAFKNVVITNEHPADGILNAQNTKHYAIGFVSSNIKIIDNSSLKCFITIYDDQTIEEIQAGKVELSAGYLYSLLMVENQDYDYIQKDIKPNHIAIVQAGRCGSECSLALDNSTSKKGNNMKKIVFKRMLPDGSEKVIQEIEVEEDQAEALQLEADIVFENSKAVIDSEKAQDEKKEMQDKIEAQDEEIEKLKSDLGEKKEVVASDAQIQTLAHDMAGVIVIAQSLGLDTLQKKPCDLKKSVISKVNPELALDGKDQNYLNYAFDDIATQLKNADVDFLKGLDINPAKQEDQEEKLAHDAKSNFNKKFGGDS